MKNTTFGQEYLAELESEVRATRRCLEAIPESVYSWKPHPRSMDMGYLTVLVADIPRWITYIVEHGEIDFATYAHFKLSTNKALLQRFEENLEGARISLNKIRDEELDQPFHLKNSGNLLYTSSKKENIRSGLNHWVHHRGQLTVYMRLRDIPVPSIYGPSADDRTF